MPTTPGSGPSIADPEGSEEPGRGGASTPPRSSAGPPHPSSRAGGEPVDTAGGEPADSAWPATQSTVEVRWFYEGPIPPPLLNRLSERQPATERRVDLYLAEPADHLVVKLRDARTVEVKSRRGSPITASLGPAVDGRVERWTKWSFEPTGHETGPPPLERSIPRRSLMEDPEWIPVGKSRWIFEAPGGRGHLEMAEIHAPRRSCWTLAFEIVEPAGADSLEPAAADPLQRLRAIVAAVRVDSPLFDAATQGDPTGGRFTVENSCSYAGWIQSAS